MDLPEAFDGGADMILFADADAAGGQNQIVAAPAAPRASAIVARSSGRMPRSATAQPSCSSNPASAKRLAS